ncbi:MFS transporter, partial [Streptomyces alkaliterrae]
MSDGAFVLTAWLAPHVLAAPLVGAVVGRARRPGVCRLLVLAVFAGSILALAVLLGRVPVWLVGVVAVVGGACGPVVSGGLSSLVALLVPAGRRRDRAYALDAASYNAASVGGPAVVAAAVTFESPFAAVAGLGMVAGVAALLAPLVRVAAPAGSSGPPPQRLGADLVTGFAVVWRVPQLRAITVATGVAFLGLGGLSATTVLLCRELGRPGDAGALLAVFALGALAGSLAVARWWPAADARKVAGWTLVGTGVALATAAGAAGAAGA